MKRRSFGPKRRSRRLAMLATGLAELERGARQQDAAYRAGYSDEFTFSRACVVLFGLRPSTLKRMDWRSVVEQARV